MGDFEHTRTGVMVLVSRTSLISSTSLASSHRGRSGPERHVFMVIGLPWTSRLRESGGGMEGEEEVDRLVYVGGGTDGGAEGTPVTAPARP